MFRKIFLLTFLLSIALKAQNMGEIDRKFQNYFKLDRENIYLHLNKNTYFSNETVWFKGYILDKKTNKLNPLTTNVYITLYNQDKNEIKNQLFYASNGITSGQIKLDKSLPSGKYFLHIYTNYMNNFIEDESTIEEFEIINIEDTPLDLHSEPEHLNFEITPEGGKLLFESDNTVVVKITDCQNKGVKLSADVTDDSGNTITSFYTNQEGYGKFDLLNTKNTTYSIKTSVANQTFSHDLPPVTIEGVNLSALTFIKQDNVLLTLKTNANTLTKIKEENLKLIIEKYDSIKFLDIRFDNLTKKDFFLEQKEFFNGLNTLRLLNSKNESIAERLIFIKKDPNKIEIRNTVKNNDSIRVKGLLKNNIGIMSISILPNSNISQNSIINHLAFENVTKEKLNNTHYYFENFDRKKQYELDLYLMGCKSKYNWNSILNDTIVQKYDYEFGIDITGKINQNIPNKEKLQLKLYTQGSLNLGTNIETDNSFYFKNLLLEDSVYCHFSLLKNNTNLKKLSVVTTLKNNNSKFLKPVLIKKNSCQSTFYEKKQDEYVNLFPKTGKIIELDSIQLVSEKKEKLIYGNTRYQNNYARAFKINETDRQTYNDVLSFISFNGFDVSVSGINVIINARASKSVLGSRTPIVYLDNTPITDFSLLLGMSLRQVDEIYINRTGFGEGMNGSNGSIRIYTRITYDKESNPTIKSSKIQIKKGFQKDIPFKNIEYQDYDHDSFKKYGVVDWKNNIYTNETGEFEFSFPHFDLKEFYLDIQGLDGSGNFFHEVLPVKL
ncbi:hypothetical protein NHF50_09780 [Flavobacterium sp. NRK F10]|uniref:hypothetical protein n=1 Tax=Flavobacterium sp. NRK F10 TaxID=2954931 RepID=UPI002091512B|nr:hypothetical protein [Flavobacterium sp. NRK F10]MCO6175331.1 hypothetical protein [Flavobacterium sp. NRK F10]